jgi:glutamyl-tRNA reductase
VAVVVVGIYEWGAPLEVFERAAIGERELPKALAELSDSPHLSEVVLISTCMRTEVYAVVERFHDGLADIAEFFHSRTGEAAERPPGAPGAHAPTVPVAPDEGAGEHRPEPGGGVMSLGGALTCWYDDAAIGHLFEVAAGIDSPVLGEGEVLRQVRDAAEHARAENAAGPLLTPLFRHAVEAGKRARSDTNIQRGTTSLAHAVVELASDHSSGMAGRRVLLVGAGEMGAGIAKALAGRPDLTGDIVVANRGAARASTVADLAGGARVTGLDDLVSELAAADVVLTSTASDEVLLGPELFAEALDQRAASGRPGPLVVVDAAVPRDVDAGVGQLAGVELLDVEDVRRYAEEQMAGRKGEVPAVRAILAEELERYRTNAAGRLAAPVVSALRQRAEALRAVELERYRSRLDGLDLAERELIETVTKRVVAKLLHEPTVRVKESAGSQRGERLAEALRTLFDL